MIRLCGHAFIEIVDVFKWYLVRDYGRSYVIEGFIIINICITYKMVENGMKTCRPVISASAKKGSSVVGSDRGPTPPDLFSRSHFPLGRERELAIRFFLDKYHPSRGPAPEFRRGLRKVYIYFSCVLLAGHCNTTTINYN